MTFGVVILILLITYRSPVLWMLPIFCAVVANTMAGGVVYLLAKYAGLVVNDQSQYILSILVIGAGTDYALLLVARYREELRRHEDRHEAMAFALHRAAPAIIASAATVVVGLMCLSFADLNSTAEPGPGPGRRRGGDPAGHGHPAARTPGDLRALDLLAGAAGLRLRRAHPDRLLGAGRQPDQRAAARRVGRSPPWSCAIACLGVFKLDANGLSTEDGFTETLDSVTAQKLLADHDLADSSNTIQVVTNDDQLPEVQEAVADIERPRRAHRPHLDRRRSQLLRGRRSSTTWPPSRPSTSSIAARDQVHAVDGADALVGGGAAFYLDTKTASQRDNKVVIPLVLLVVLVILVLLLRALTAPLILIGTVILSFGAALGLSSLIFHYVFDFAGADAGFPLFAFVFLVALGVDYNIFLMTRVREETASTAPARAR